MVMLSGQPTWGARRTIHLDGTWQIAQGAMDVVPSEFTASVPVPGMVDMATPAFTEVGVKSPQRQVFWYKRTFKIDGSIGDVALLKIHKAKFGKKVFLNGELVGEHLPNFTPVTLDVKEFLKGNGVENELVIRIGADNMSVAAGRAYGYDKEKIIYIPGVYDSVELILTGAPYITNIQTAPNVGTKQVRVVAELGKGVSAGSGKLNARVVEAKSGRVVGTKKDLAFTLDADSKAKLDFEVAIARCKLWSPENPFLYRLELDCGTDAKSVRFGMRSFRFDAETRLGFLNEKPYYLRGTNLCMFRFMEDAERSDTVWRKEWVRRLFRKMKGVNWNSFRFTLGYPPDFWYDIADEEGLLIQDEYPIWDHVPSVENMTIEFTEWMRERWNHPSVVIWDAQNETTTEATTAAIKSVRGLDLSNRPWDNGRGSTGEITDCWEAHPYLFINHKYAEMYTTSPTFRLRDLENAPQRPWKYGHEGQIPAAQIINEYAWLWLNRDGSPTWLTDELYDNLIGPDSTTEQRREFFARNLAGLTEYWRSRRTCAGVQQFSFLTHSRPSDPRGATSDFFMDVETLELESNFLKYVPDSFSPVGVCIDFWQDEFIPGTGDVDVPVIVINDRYTAWKGKLTLKVLDGKRTVWKKRISLKVDGLGMETAGFNVPMPSKLGQYQWIAQLDKVDGKSVRSLRDIKVVEVIERAMTATMEPGSAWGNIAAHAIDGNPATIAQSASPVWDLKIDMGKVSPIDKIRIHPSDGGWASDYSIKVSTDNKNWTGVDVITNAKSGTRTIEFDKTDARYVWMDVTGVGHTGNWGHGVCEFEIYMAK
jgi:hypothetical protein